MPELVGHLAPTSRGLMTLKKLCTWIVAFLLTPALLAAQATTGSVSGSVTDETKAVMPGVTLTTRNVDTGAERTQVSDAQGRYRVLNLSPGVYTVTSELAGFSPVVRANLTVEIGKDVLVDIEMKVGAVTEQVTVAGETSLVELGASVVGGVVTTKQIAELPLNGRSFMQLATLQPGVAVSRGTPRDFTGGFGNTQVSIGGARPEQTGYLLEGTNIADISDKAPSSMSGVLLGVDTVQEFSVQTHGYSAEFGRAAGGIISAVTKSGTNQFRGSGFEFFRDASMDSAGYFDTDGAPPFTRHQFGGTLGGPLRKNKLFFFGSYEGLREKLATTQVTYLPNAAAHEGRLPDGRGGLRQVVVNPLAKQYLDLLYPLPNGKDVGDGTAEHRFARVDPTHENFIVGKLDWSLTNNDSMLLRVSSDISETELSTSHPLFLEFTGTDTRYITSQWQHLFSSNVLNQLRGAINRTARDDDMLPTIEIPQSLFWSEDPHWGALNIQGGGIPTAGNISTIPVLYAQNLFELADTFTWNKGSHTMKFGLDVQRYHFDGYSYSRYGGEFRFRNLEEYLTQSRIDRFTGNLPGTDTQRNMRQNYWAFFAQDDYRVSTRFSLSYGLRYEFVTTPYDLENRVAGLLKLEDLESGPKGVTPGSDFFKNPSKKSFAPRLGIGWNPFGDERTAIRGGYGVFYQPLTVSFYRGTAFRVYPYFAGVDIRQPTVFGPGNIAVLARGVNPALVQKRSEFLYYDAKQPFIHQWHANFERELRPGLTAGVGYMGSKGRNMPFYGDPNAVPSQYLPDGRKQVVPGAVLRYPSWGRIRTRINVSRSLYHGFTASLNQRFNKGLLFQASYTYGNGKDTWSGGQSGGNDFDNGAGSASDWWDPEAEWGPSNFDVHHTGVFNAVYLLPWGQNLTGAAGALAKGWQIGGIFQVSSGTPFTPYSGFDRAGDKQSDTTQQKVDQVGTVTYPKTVDQWFDVTAFALPPAGFFGNAGRNSLRGPIVKVADVSAFKNQRIGRTALQFRIEVFNLFDWVNFGFPSAGQMFNTNGTRNVTAGRITSLSTTARQIQLGIKFAF